MKLELIWTKYLDVLFPFDPLPSLHLAQIGKHYIKIDYWQDSTRHTKQMTHFQIEDRVQSFDLSEAHEFHVQYIHMKKKGYAAWTQQRAQNKISGTIYLEVSDFKSYYKFVVFRILQEKIVISGIVYVVAYVMVG